MASKFLPFKFLPFKLISIQYISQILESVKYYIYFV
nr:MAG TPA: hypothetical protein [Caudoviricetes sp.]